MWKLRFALCLLLALLLTGCGGQTAAKQAGCASPAVVEPPREAVAALLEGMTLREKAAQLFIVTPEQMEGEPVGGVILFSEHIADRRQVMELISELQAQAKLGLFITVDEEGGTVSRLGSNPNTGVTRLPNMGTLADNVHAREVGLTLARELSALGFHIDFAPVADVNSNPNNPVIGIRSFSSDPAVAAQRVAACVEGFRAGGLACTLKHFPGHGDTDSDTHLGTVVTQKTLAQLRECELLPFVAGVEAGAELVMVSHISLPKVTGENTPATLSRYVTTDLLRGELGFDGLVITDSMSMAAITDHYTAGEAAVLALQAGADLILMPEDLSEAVDSVVAAVEDGTLTQARLDESLARIFRLKLERNVIEP